jgi:hypothetical protein
MTTQLVVVEISIDGGETWEDCSGPITREEAGAIKRNIDHNSDGCGIDVRVKTLG